MRKRIIVTLMAFLLVAWGFPQVAAAEDQVPGKNRAVLGTVLGALVGSAAAGIFYSAGNCHKGNDWYDNVWVDCALPASAMVAGGAIAGYFIGRSSDRNVRATKAVPAGRPESADIIALVPQVKLRRLPDTVKARDTWGVLFQADEIDLPGKAR